MVFGNLSHMSDWNVEVDTAKNRLYIDISAALSAEEATRSTDQVVDAANNTLDPGFDVITDIREFEPGTPEAVEQLERGKKAMRENGCSAAVRVMPESATASMHFERVGEDEEAYPVAEAETVDQAEKLLDERRSQEA